MKQRQLGANGPLVSALALGCMGMSEFYGKGDDAESLATLDLALEKGVNFWDTADVYGPHSNETLLAKALKDRRSQVFLASKFGIVRDPSDPAKRGVNGRPDYVRRSVEGSLKRLGTDHLDLYYQHRPDPTVPVEETVGAMGELVKEGKVRFLGLSEVDAATLRRAHKEHPISAVQSEYSLWTRDPEREVLASCAELGVGFVAYSPLGRGFLSGAIRSVEDFDADDFRRGNPRFMGENFQKNLALVDAITALARDKNVSASQLALAWLLAKGEHVVPLFGTKRRRYLLDNLGALEVSLSARELAEIDAVFPPEVAAGTRYSSEVMKLLPR
ncbi:aldo/keto reductase [Gallaecimonas pentaromativorans]|uniref:Aryl-alcohol dehydrogenase-like predicted oxidoreductase n=1 Tax=Gallaecimonas pentaromativorans TaxID=584787 RepID=A0A3N1P6T6_9GAMM|nr:aldo/keto reductase [Gallaecimonas pentaromativorans]ROQ22450.1 aryl-alcohol dehydrogenase-like predicted oxidoreductase [Gallaecimonas pentaromativorans]